MAHDIFISYAEEDESFALETHKALEHMGYSCWIAVKDVLPASDFADQIPRAITSSRLLIALLSAHSLKSKHVRREVGIADKATNTVVLFVRIDSVPLTGWSEYHAVDNQWLNISWKQGDASIDSMLQTVSQLLGPKSKESLRGNVAVEHPDDAVIPLESAERAEARIRQVIQRISWKPSVWFWAGLVAVALFINSVVMIIVLT